MWIQQNASIFPEIYDGAGAEALKGTNTDACLSSESIRYGMSPLLFYFILIFYTYIRF